MCSFSYAQMAAQGASTAMRQTGVIISAVQRAGANRFNKKVARDNARRVAEAGVINEAAARDRMKREIARGVARAAAGGVNLAAGSVPDVLREAGEQSFLDQQSVRSQAQGLKRRFLMDAELSRLEARRAIGSGIFQFHQIGLDSLAQMGSSSGGEELFGKALAAFGGG